MRLPPEGDKRYNNLHVVFASGIYTLARIVGRDPRGTNSSHGLRRKLRTTAHNNNHNNNNIQRQTVETSITMRPVAITDTNTTATSFGGIALLHPMFLRPLVVLLPLACPPHPLLPVTTSSVITGAARRAALHFCANAVGGGRLRGQRTQVRPPRGAPVEGGRRRRAARFRIHSLQGAINLGRPQCVLVGWNGGGRHGAHHGRRPDSGALVDSSLCMNDQ